MHRLVPAIPRAPNPLRRKLLLGLPGGLALASPLAFLGCGGGGDAGTTAGTDTDPPGPLASSTMDVQIELPASLAASAGALQVVTATGTSTVSGSRASVSVVADGPQLVSVVGVDGSTLLLGWAGKDQPAISVQSTAAVLLHFGLGLSFLGVGARDTLRMRLQGQAAVAAFGERIGAELGTDRRALTTLSAGIVEGFEQAAAALLPADAVNAASTRKNALGLVVEPATDLSGLQVVQGETPNSFFVDNAYVRRAVVVVNREGWTDSAGDHDEPGAPVQVGEVMPLALPAAIDSVANVVGGWASEYYSPDDPGGFWRSVSDTVTADITPSDAKRTRYSVVVLMAGALPPQDAAAFARLPASQQAYVTGLDLGKNLVLQTLFNDLLAPLFFEFLSSRVGAVDKHASEATKADAAVLEKFAAEMLTTLQSRLPDVIEKVAAGSMDAWTAFKTILKACTFNPDTGEMSPLLQEFLTQGATLLAKELAAVGLRSRMLDAATGIKVGGKGVLGFLPVLSILSKFDAVLSKAALLRIVADGARSRRMESWSVVATKAKVVLKPDPLEVEPTGVTYPVTAEIVDNDDDEYGIEKGSIIFDWDCSGLYGTLYSRADAGLESPNHFRTSKDYATTDYLPKGIDDDPAAPETITVKAYFEPIGSGGTRTLIGSATATLKFKKAFSLKLAPGVPTDVPSDTDFPLHTFFNETLPSGTTVDWVWTHGGTGALTAAPPPEANASNSIASFASGSSEGSASIQVQATVHVPAAAGKPARTVVTGPVSTTLSVKKGLRTITFRASGGVFACGPTCGVTDYTAYIVPRLAKATNYTAVFSDFGYGPCNRSVSWTTEKGDGGGCSFPISYHPFSARDAAKAWAVWIGFGGTLPTDGHVDVTITLAP